MPYFHYSAMDATGKAVEGTIQARDAGEATRLLAQRGLQLRQVLGDQPKSAEIRTRTMGLRERQFLFTQLTALLRSAIGPSHAFAEIANRNSANWMGAPLLSISQSLAEGGRISDALRRYPDLFPDYVAGLVRCGEDGGFLVESTQAAADQAENAEKFRKSHWWLRFLAWNIVLSLPFIWLMNGTLLSTWDRVDAAGGMTSGFQEMERAILELFKWPVGPGTVMIGAACYAIVLWMKTPPMKAKIDAIMLRMPVYGPRELHEGLSVFSYTLAGLSKAGVSPKSAWVLAAESVPNADVRRQLKAIGEGMNETTRFSQAAAKSNLIPKQYLQILATGEQTGGVPTALGQIAQISRGEFDDATQSAKKRGPRIGCFAMVVIGILTEAVFFSSVAKGLMDRVLGGFGR